MHIMKMDKSVAAAAAGAVGGKGLARGLPSPLATPLTKSNLLIKRGKSKLLLFNFI